MTSRGYSDPRRCPVPVRRTRRGADVICANRVSPGAFMCADHWYRVPSALRARVRATWDTWAGDDFGDLAAQGAYLAARQEALDRAGKTSPNG